MNTIKENTNLKKIVLEESDHLGICIRFFGILHLIKGDNNGSIGYFSKFKMKDKQNKIFKRLHLGLFTLNYKDITIYINILNIGTPVGLQESSKIHTLIELYLDKSNVSILEDFFDEASKYYVNTILDKNKEKDKTTIYIWDDYWETIEKRPCRKLDTIYLGGLETKIYKDIKLFLTPEKRELYNSLGIPYKLNMLLHGFPGTGKSSLIYSLASELGMDVALLHFIRDMNDVDFMRALRRIPENTILVLEDIDVLFESRKKNDENKSGISFSGLLNSLDGISHLDNQIIVMTTNCKMVLDNALTRPGRIDMDVEFKYSTKKQIKTMFYKFIPKQTNRFDEFYNEIKNLNITTAILQQYLFGNINCDNILTTIDELKNSCSKNNYDFKKDTLYT